MLHPTRTQLDEILQVTAQPCLSLFMPTFRAPPENQQNPIRFRNLARKFEVALARYQGASDGVKSVTSAIQGLLDDPELWRTPGDGLALFVAPGFVRYFNVQFPCTESVEVGERFHIKPLTRPIRADETFYVLTISQKRVRLFHGGREGVRDVPAKNLPQSLAAALFTDEHEHAPQFHVTSARLGKRALVAFGNSGGTKETFKKDLLEYFRLIDKGLREVLQGKGAPLVFMGVDYYVPLYREVNSYPLLFDEHVAGNPDRLSDHEIHQAAWKLVEASISSRDVDRALTVYEKSRVSRKTGQALDEVVRNACDGNVELLFVSGDRSEWGTYDETTRRITVHETRQAGDGDLHDLAAAQTLLHGGEVFALPHEKIPDGGLLAAAYRHR